MVEVSPRYCNRLLTPQMDLLVTIARPQKNKFNSKCFVKMVSSLSLTRIHSCSIIQKAKHKSSSQILSPLYKRSSCRYWAVAHTGGQLGHEQKVEQYEAWHRRARSKPASSNRARERELNFTALKGTNPTKDFPVRSSSWQILRV
jgi:hypothetical protein